MLLGLSPQEIENRKQRIIDFAELGIYIDSPLKTFSSGMLMRLAFSIAIHADPQCFIVDEALAVGDAYFQQKCMRKIHEFREAGGSILVVSHDLNGIKTLCNRAILIENGAIVMEGEPKKVVDYFEGTVLHDLHQGEGEVSVDQTIGTATTSTGEISLEWVKLQDDDGRELASVVSEEAVTIGFAVTANRAISSPHYGIAIRDRYGRSAFETNTYCMGQSPPPRGGRWRFDHDLLPLRLQSGARRLFGVDRRGQRRLRPRLLQGISPGPPRGAGPCVSISTTMPSSMPASPISPRSARSITRPWDSRHNRQAVVAAAVWVTA